MSNSEIKRLTRFLGKSNSELKRLVRGGAVSIDGKKITDVNAIITITKPSILKVGKRHFVRLIPVECEHIEIKEISIERINFDMCLRKFECIKCGKITMSCSRCGTNEDSSTFRISELMYWKKP